MPSDLLFDAVQVLAGSFDGWFSRDVKRNRRLGTSDEHDLSIVAGWRLAMNDGRRQHEDGGKKNTHGRTTS